MKTIDTYYVNRNGKNIWLSQNCKPLETDAIVEVRPMIFADDGKTLSLNGKIVGQCIWTKDNSIYEEIDEPINIVDEEVERCLI